MHTQSRSGLISEPPWTVLLFCCLLITGQAQANPASDQDQAAGIPAPVPAAPAGPASRESPDTDGSRPVTAEPTASPPPGLSRGTRPGRTGRDAADRTQPQKQETGPQPMLQPALSPPAAQPPTPSAGEVIDQPAEKRTPEPVQPKQDRQQEELHPEREQRRQQMEQEQQRADEAERGRREARYQQFVREQEEALRKDEMARQRRMELLDRQP